jgi:hypothetical protein
MLEWSFSMDVWLMEVREYRVRRQACSAIRYIFICISEVRLSLLVLRPVVPIRDYLCLCGTLLQK